MGQHIFLSYSRKDKDIAQKIVQDLNKAGIDVWVDTQELKVGEPDWEQSVRDAIRKAYAVVLVVSLHINKSPYIRAELAIAEMYRCPIYPFWVAGKNWAECAPMALIGMQYADGRGSHYKKGVDNIIDAIRKLEPRLIVPEGSIPSRIFPNSDTSYGIRVLVVDDHNMVAKGLATLLLEFDDMVVIGEAADGEIAYKMCQNESVDVVLMDTIMPRMDGITATKKIRTISPATQVMMLTSFADKHYVQTAFEAGAISFLMKNISGDELANAIRRAHQGLSTLSPEAAQVLIKLSTRPPSPGHDLTEQELEILAYMIEGLNNREIGEHLTTSSSTVKKHVSSILSKLGTISRTQAVALAVEHKIIK